MSRNHGESPGVNVHLEEPELIHVINALSMVDDLDGNESTPLVGYLQNKLKAYREHQERLKVKARARRDQRVRSRQQADTSGEASPVEASAGRVESVAP